MSPLPLISIAVACRDDEAGIEACVRAAQAQDWPHDRLEILVADGMSIDGTREILARLAAEDPRVRLVDNPGRVPAAGLNACIRRARGEFVVRMDARGEYEPGFVRRCVGALEDSGADHVGAPARARGASFFQRCAAAALGSPLGLGLASGTRRHAFRRAVFERAGLFDERALASEDAELDQRIADAGGRLHEAADVGAFYRPRETMRALARQTFKLGQGRARTLLKHRRFASWQTAVPFLWLLGEAALLATSPWQPLGPWTLAAYALATGAEAVRVGRHEGPLAVPVVWAIFPVLHVAHGAGFAAGLARYAFKPDWGDTLAGEWPLGDPVATPTYSSSTPAAR